MALTCARCGAQNPDGNLFCQNCGTPLTAAAAAGAAAPPAPTAPFAPGQLAGPPPGMAPPTFGPGGYQSPYYAPSAATVPVHRTPWMLIIAAVVALIILATGLGTALVVFANHNGTASNSGVGDVPSPTPATSPSPVASPTSTPTYGNTTESNAGLSVPVPSGWTVASKDNESIVLADPNGDGSISLASGPSVPSQTAADNKKTIDDFLKSKYPDVRACPNTSTRNTVFNGASGISWTACFTLTSGSTAIPAAASLFAGANSSGSVYYVVMVLTRQDNLANYLNLAKPVLQGVQWKLS